MRKVKMTILPVMGVDDCVQVRLQGDGVNVLTEGRRASAIEHATTEVTDEHGPFTIAGVTDMTRR